MKNPFKYINSPLHHVFYLGPAWIGFTKWDRWFWPYRSTWNEQKILWPRIIRVGWDRTK